MASRSAHLPTTSAVPRSPPNHPRSGSPTCSSGRCSRRPGIAEPVRLRAGGHARPAGLADLRGHRSGHRRSRRRARPPGAARVRQGHQGRPGPAAACSRPGPSTGRSDLARAGRSCSTAVVAGWTGTLPPAACTSSPRPPTSGHQGAPSYAPSYRRDHARCRRRPPRRPDRRASRRPAHHDSLRQGPPEPGPSPQLHPRGLHGLWHLVQPASPELKLRETPCIADKRTCNGGSYRCRDLT